MAAGYYNITLLLTACIEPIQFKNKVQRNNSETRLSDYKNALKLWLHHNDKNITHIIFAENSGYNLSEIEQVFKTENIYNRKFTFFQVIASQVPNGLHYGYSELELIDQVIQNNIIESEKFFIKCTGRIYFPNVSKLINKTIPTFNFVADSRIYRLLKWKKSYVLSDLFISNVNWYKKNLMNKKDKMQVLQASHFEILLFKLLYKNKRQKNVLLRFPMNVNPIGTGAHWNVSYQSFDKKISYIFRGICRKLFPNFWI